MYQADHKPITRQNIARRQIVLDNNKIAFFVFEN